MDQFQQQCSVLYLKQLIVFQMTALHTYSTTWLTQSLGLFYISTSVEHNCKAFHDQRVNLYLCRSAFSLCMLFLSDMKMKLILWSYRIFLLFIQEILPSSVNQANYSLDKFFHGLSQFLQTNPRIVPKIKQQLFPMLSKSLFTYHSTTQLCKNWTTECVSQ